MGLAIGVGMLPRLLETNPDGAERLTRDMARINTFLANAGLPTHEEPESFEEEFSSRASLTSFPYSWLHYLRRFSAHVMRDPRWVPYPIEPGEDPADDPVLRQMYRALSSHLLCHSDSEGYYLPLDFQELLLDPTHEKLPGGVVGSSYRLRDDLLLLTDPLEIPVVDGDLSDTAAQEIAAQRPTGAPFAVERLVWLALFEAARLSIKHKTAILFF